MPEKIIDITIKPDGTIDFDQLGYDGKGCQGDIDEIIREIGKVKSVKRKKEFYKTEKVKIKQRRII